MVKYVISLLVMLTLVGCEFFFPKSVEYEQLKLPNRSAPEDIGTFVSIAGGSFTMGAPPEAESNPAVNPGGVVVARPQHPEQVSGFEIGKYEVTAKEFCEFLNDIGQERHSISDYVLVDEYSTIIETEEGYKPRKGYANAPALHVQFYGAVQYCVWLSERIGRTCRLPSEVEWEFAARGDEGRTYPWGEASHLGRGYFRAHYASHDSPSDPGVVTVGLFPDGASPEGVYDLIGNAPEWCCNYFDEYSSESITENEELYLQYINRQSLANLHPLMAGVPCAAVRGGQHVKRGFVMTGWDRIGRPIYGSRQAIRKVSGCGFRVYREIGRDESYGEIQGHP